MQMTYLEAKRMQQAMAEHIGKHRWDHMVTLTHRYDGNPEAQRKEVLTLIRNLERVARMPVRYAVFSEKTIEGRLHHHALTYGTAHVPQKALQRQWRSGHSQFKTFDRERGGADYTAKAYGSSQSPDVEFSKPLPPLWTDSVEIAAPIRQRPTGHLAARLHRKDRYGRKARGVASRPVSKRAATEPQPTRRRPSAPAS